MFPSQSVVLVLCALCACAAARARVDAPGRFPRTQQATEGAVKSHPKRDFKPVHERFPSAVLFGRTCGGTIISDRWIISAAHCTLSISGRDVVAGTNNTMDGSGVTRYVKRIVLHPLFTVGPYWLKADDYDIKQVAAHWNFLLAELNSPLPLDGKTIAAAKLNAPTEIPPELKVAIAGYGTEHAGVMHEMRLMTVSDNECSTLEQYNKEEMLCAKGFRPWFEKACNGISGSGLMRHKKLIGVLSWGEDDSATCRKGTKLYFSRVSAVRDWIREVTGI